MSYGFRWMFSNGYSRIARNVLLLLLVVAMPMVALVAVKLTWPELSPTSLLGPLGPPLLLLAGVGLLLGNICWWPHSDHRGWSPFWRFVTVAVLLGTTFSLFGAVALSLQVLGQFVVLWSFFTGTCITAIGVLAISRVVTPSRVIQLPHPPPRKTNRDLEVPCPVIKLKMPTFQSRAFMGSYLSVFLNWSWALCLAGIFALHGDNVNVDAPVAALLLCLTLLWYSRRARLRGPRMFYARDNAVLGALQLVIFTLLREQHSAIEVREQFFVACWLLIQWSAFFCAAKVVRLALTLEPMMATISRESLGEVVLHMTQVICNTFAIGVSGFLIVLLTIRR